VRKTALKFVETINVGKKFANDQHRPTVGENLGCPGDRAILSVTVHEV